MTLKEEMREEIENIIYGSIHQGELDEDLPIYGQEKAVKKLVKLFEQIERKYCKFVGVETTDGNYWCEVHNKWEKPA